MSIIGIVYTNDGFVIGADGRGGRSNSDAKKDCEQKIFEASCSGNLIAYALTGLTALSNGSGDDFIGYSKLIAKELRTAGYSTGAEYADAFAGYLLSFE